MTPCAPLLSTAEPDWAAFAAIDWASRKHFWSLAPCDGGPPESGTLDNTPEAIELWAMALRQRFAARPIAVAIEQKRGSHRMPFDGALILDRKVILTIPTQALTGFVPATLADEPTA